VKKFNEPQRYTDEELQEMVRTMTYPQDAPPFVIKAIREMRRKIERKIKSPQKEMDDFMKELKGSKKWDK